MVRGTQYAGGNRVCRMGNLPTPLRPEEVAQILKRMEAEAPTV